MKDIITLFEKYAKYVGISEPHGKKIAAYLVLLSILATILKLLYNGFVSLMRARNRKFLNSDLSPFYSPADVYIATKYYVHTKCQSADPSIDDEPGKLYSTFPREKLISFFLDRMHPKSLDLNKFYLLLADTGMGKTTFMMNLYLKYKNKFRFSWSIPPYDMFLFPLGAPNVIDKIKQIQNKHRSILLLDAFDEDIAAVKLFCTNE